VGTLVRLLLALMISAALPLTAAAQPPQFTVEVLPAPDGGGVAYDINDIGLIVGHVVASGTHAVLWNGRKMSDLGGASLPATFGQGERPVGINRSGAGFFNSGANAILFNARSLPGGGATIYNAALAGINDAGQMVGTSEGAATVWDGTIVRRLPSGSAGLALNNSTVVAGFIDGGSPTAIRWTSDGDVDSIQLLTSSDVASAGFAIDDFGNVAGTVIIDGTNHAAAWFGVPIAQLTALPELPQSVGSRAWDININQWIVGESTTSTGPRATLWVDGTAYELSTLVAGSSPFQSLRTAFGLNDRGEIVGAGVAGDVIRPFVLRPKKGNRTR
jgi:hypothetical protein